MKFTPDLSSSFHPIPKPNAKVKSHSKRINPIGKKGKENIDANKQMHEMFKELGITSCEIKLENCWRDNALGYAHLDKRRFLSKEDLITGVLACVICHQKVEVLPREEMKKILTKIIKKRKSTLVG
jgi:hypothetical protein